MLCKRRGKEVKIQKSVYRDVTNVEPEMYDCTGNNWSHWNSNEMLKEKFWNCTRKTSDRFTTKDSYTRNITHNTESTAVWSLKRERWGSLLVQEKYREEMPVTGTSISYNNNSISIVTRMCIEVVGVYIHISLISARTAIVQLSFRTFHCQRRQSNPFWTFWTQSSISAGTQTPVTSERLWTNLISIHCVPGTLSPGVKQTERESNHAPFPVLNLRKHETEREIDVALWRHIS
jgi:hypothetical protein